MSIRSVGRKRRLAGFTLIELMIVVAVIAILVAIAYPSYQDSVRKARRGQAKADLVELAQIMERYHTVNNTYVTPTSWVNPISQSPKTGTAHYTIAVSNLQPTTFTLTATPVAGGPQASDTRCGALSINQAGQKNETGTGTVADCW